MSFINTRPRVLALGTVCAAAGVGAGTVAVAGASSGHTAPATTGTAQHAAKGRAHGLLKLARHSVHSEFVIRTPRGFKTVTVNSGTVDSVSGDTLTMTDSTPRASYEKQTLTVPSTARVRNNRQKASLSSLTAGEHVMVVQLPRRMVVVARPARAAKTTSSSSTTTTSSDS